MENLVKNIEKNLVVIGIDNENAELISSLRKSVASEFVSVYDIIDNRFDNDIDEVLKDSKVADLLVMNGYDLHDALCGYYWSIVLKQFNNVYTYTSTIGILTSENFMPIIDEYDFHFDIDALREFAESCRNTATTEEKEQAGIIKDIANFVENKIHVINFDVKNEDTTDNDEDETDETNCNWVVKLHIGYHPAYTIKELRRRITNRLRYKWTDCKTFAFQLDEDSNNEYDAVIYLKCEKEGGDKYTAEEIEDAIKYRFGKTCPNPWYRCHLVSVEEHEG